MNVCYANCFQDGPSFAMLPRLLRTSIVLNQKKFVENFIFGKFYSISKKLCPRFSKKASIMVLLKKKKERKI